VFLFYLAVNQNIISLYHHKLTNARPKHLVHKPHRDTRCIKQTERHD